MKFKWLIMLVWLSVSVLFINAYYLIVHETNVIAYHLSPNTLTENEVAFLKDKGELIFAADPNYPPLHFINPSTGQYEGIVIDYLNALSMTLGVNIKTKPMLWHVAFDALEAGSIDFFDMHPSEERAKRFDFSLPVYHQRGAILVEKGHGIEDLHSLKGKTIAAIKDDYVIEHMVQNQFDVTLLEAVDLKGAIDFLKSGQAFAVAGDESAMQYYMDKAQLNEAYELIDFFLYEREAVLAVGKDQIVLLNILNKGIRQLKREDTMGRITRKWFGHPPLISKPHAVKGYYFLMAYIGVMGFLLLLLFVFWTKALKKEVQAQTQELRLAEKQMLQSSKMAALGQLAAGIAHEVKTPLAIIRNATYLLKKNAEDADQIASIEMIDSATKRANKIINNLLNFSRLSDYKIDTFFLKTAINDLLLLNQTMGSVHDVTYTLDVPEQLCVSLYSESFKHIFQNLIANAFEAMPNGGRLDISAEEKDHQILIKVSDTGMGINETDLASIFDPFFTTKENQNGTGLGLYIVYNELLKMNGSIEVFSKANQGTSFHITLPKTIAPQEDKG